MNIEDGWVGREPLAEATVRLPEDIVRDLDRHAEAVQGERRAPVDARPDDSVCWTSVAGAIRERLEMWPGFVLVTGFPAGPDGDVEYPRRLVHRFGEHIGGLLPQDTAGTSVYEVVDTGASVAEGARFSVTNKPTGFHTDNSFERDVPRYIALHCVESAQSGGESQLASGHSVVRALADTDPAALERLRAPIHFDRRGGVPAGETPYATYPVVGGSGEHLMIRYLRYYIESGYTRAGRPIDDETTAALDAFDLACAHPDLTVEFSLGAGQMLIVNNHCVLHSRSGFSDRPTQRRRLLRVWLRPHDRLETPPTAGARLDTARDVRA